MHSGIIGISSSMLKSDLRWNQDCFLPATWADMSITLPRRDIKIRWRLMLAIHADALGIRKVEESSIFLSEFQKVDLGIFKVLTHIVLYAQPH